MDKTCVNCGAAFDVNEPKCPYCGHINEIGAEKEYQDKLEDIREKLDIVDNIAEDNYKESIKTFFKAMFGTTAIVLIIAFIIWNIYRIGDRAYERKELEKGIEAINSCKEIFETRDNWNKLYAAEEYEELYKAIERDGNTGSTYSWEHYYFYDGYANYKKTIEELAEVNAEGYTLRDYDVSSIFYSGFSLYYEKDNEKRLTHKDREVLNELWNELADKICETLDISNDELLVIADSCMDEYGMSYSKAREKAKEYMEGRK